MLHRIIISVAIVAVSVMTLFFYADGRSPTQAKIMKATTRVAAAPGRIEGARETVAVGASTTGVVQGTFVKQGDRVAIGQLLGRLECDDVIAEIPQRMAEYSAAQAFYERLKNGNRPEDVAIAEADVQLSAARMIEAENSQKRNYELSQRAVASRAQFDVAERNAGIAAAQVAIAQQKLKLMIAGARAEEIAEAKARVEAALNIVAVTKARLAKCEIRSPIDGRVLRKHVSEGELISVFLPKPLFTVADVSRYRVRAEVDEKDLPLIQLGQLAEIVLDEKNNSHLNGTVVEIGQFMGRRLILTTDPADKSDRDILEVLIDVDGVISEPPIGLRVSVIFLKFDELSESRRHAAPISIGK